MCSRPQKMQPWQHRTLCPHRLARRLSAPGGRMGNRKRLPEERIPRAGDSSPRRLTPQPENGLGGPLWESLDGRRTVVIAICPEGLAHSEGQVASPWAIAADV